MTVQPVHSEESEDEASPPPRERAHRRKYQLLLERCDVLRQDNERILNRIHEARRITRRYQRDIKLLTARLERHREPRRPPRLARRPPRTTPRPRRHKPAVRAPHLDNHYTVNLDQDL